MTHFLTINLLTYITLFICIALGLIISAVVLGLSYLLVTQSPDAEKSSAYECGFEPFEDARNTFDIKFYLIAILFLIFDIEVVFLFPWAVSLKYLGSLGFWVGIDFVVELLIGYVYVWKKGAFD